MKLLARWLFVLGTATGLVLMVATSAAAQQAPPPADSLGAIGPVLQPNNNFFRAGATAV